MEISRIDLLADTHLDLLAHQIGKGPANRLPHYPFHAPGDLELTSAGRASNFKAVQADLALVVNRRGVHRSRVQRIERDHVPSALFGDSDELLFSCFVINQRKGRLVKLERS